MSDQSTEAWQDESNDPSVNNQSRFDSQEEAIAWAEENGQGQLTTNPDGTITNRNGEQMGYDSDGNLAPIPNTTPEENNPSESNSDVEEPHEATPPSDEQNTDDSPAQDRSSDNDVPTESGYESRHSSEEEAIAWAQENGQGQLTRNPDGTITNRNGEVMVYDSDGNLAPSGDWARNAASSTRQNYEAAQDYIDSIDPDGDLGITTDQAGNLYDRSGNPFIIGQYPNDAFDSDDEPTEAWQDDSNDPHLDNPSRFDSIEEAITWAEENGQGELTINEDGTITNRNGEQMGYDSEGNLAPIPGTMPEERNPATSGPSANQNYSKIPIPAFGTPEYKALLLETGRSDLIGFNYEAHLAVKTENSLDDFELYYNAESGEALVALLSETDINQLMANAASSQVQQLVEKFGEDPNFAAFLEGRTAVEMPEQGSAQYDQLLQQTGLSTLDSFDYEAHIRALTEAERALQISKLNKKFTADNIRIFQKDATNTHIDKSSPVVIIGSDDDEEIIGGDSNDVFLPGAGNDILDGGSGIDNVILNAKKEAVRIIRDPETGEREIEFTPSAGESGVIRTKNIERINLEDTNLALDLSPEENGGKTALFIGALAPDALNDGEKFGTVLDLVDGEYNDLTALSQLAIDVGLISGLAGGDRDEDLARLVGTNILGEERAEVTELLTGFMNGTHANLSQAEFLAAVSGLQENQEHINLIGLSESGIEYNPLA